MVVIQVVLVPDWRGMPAPGFRRWFATHSDRIRAVMLPLGAGSVVANATSLVLAAGRGNRPSSVLATAATAGVVAITLAVNEPMNHGFAGDLLTDDEAADLLRRWARWHSVRVALGVAGTVAATVALADRDT